MIDESEVAYYYTDSECIALPEGLNRAMMKTRTDYVNGRTTIDVFEAETARLLHALDAFHGQGGPDDH